MIRTIKVVMTDEGCRLFVGPGTIDDLICDGYITDASKSTIHVWPGETSFASHETDRRSAIHYRHRDQKIWYSELHDAEVSVVDNRKKKQKEKKNRMLLYWDGKTPNMRTQLRTKFEDAAYREVKPKKVKSTDIAVLIYSKGPSYRVSVLKDQTQTKSEKGIIKHFRKL